MSSIVKPHTRCRIDGRRITTEELGQEFEVDDATLNRILGCVAIVRREVPEDQPKGTFTELPPDEDSMPMDKLKGPSSADG